MEKSEELCVFLELDKIYNFEDPVNKIKLIEILSKYFVLVVRDKMYTTQQSCPKVYTNLVETTISYLKNMNENIKKGYKGFNIYKYTCLCDELKKENWK